MAKNKATYSYQEILRMVPLLDDWASIDSILELINDEMNFYSDFEKFSMGNFITRKCYELEIRDLNRARYGKGN